MGVKQVEVITYKTTDIGNSITKSNYRCLLETAALKLQKHMVSGSLWKLSSPPPYQSVVDYAIS